MADTPNRPTDPNAPKAVKDKNCQFCGQAFTSSSLGRHLDLYIKERNPKPPDGVHDVEEIRKIRGNVTRRQPKGGSISRRDTSASIGTPTAVSRRSPGSEIADTPAPNSPISRKEGNRFTAARERKYPFNTPWEVTGVISDISPVDGDRRRASDGDAGEGSRVPVPTPQRAMNRHAALKQDHETRRIVQEAKDHARAAELALLEFANAFRSAKCVSQ